MTLLSLLRERLLRLRNSMLCVRRTLTKELPLQRNAVRSLTKFAKSTGGCCCPCSSSSRPCWRILRCRSPRRTRLTFSLRSSTTCAASSVATGPTQRTFCRPCCSTQAVWTLASHKHGTASASSEENSFHCSPRSLTTFTASKVRAAQHQGLKSGTISASSKP
eukprot:Rmarinus@m.13146